MANGSDPNEVIAQSNKLQNSSSAFFSYPENILQDNSEVNRAIRFTAYEYIFGQTVGNTQQNMTTYTPVTSIYLPIPKVTESESQTYAAMSGLGVANITPEQVSNFLSSTSDFVTSVGEKITDSSDDNSPTLASRAYKMAASTGELVKPLMVKRAYEMFRKFAGDDFQAIRRNALNGADLNPLATKLYDSTPLRSFSFDFELIARSASETIQIDGIVKSFKKLSRASAGALKANYEIPNVVGEFGAKLGVSTLKHPHIWQIEFVDSSEGNTRNFLPSIKSCVLTSVSVTYSGSEDGRPVFFAETGAPLKYTITLSFDELYIVTAEDVDTNV